MLLSNRNQLSKMIALTMSTLLILLFFAACAPAEKNGNLKISFEEAQARVLAPAISLDAASYTVSGNGPYNSSFNESTTDSPLQINSLETGEWIITVDAYNAEGARIATGTNSVNVTSGETASLNILLLPPAGTGSLLVDVFWDDSVVSDPVIESRLTSGSGNTLELSANQVDTGHSEISNSTISTGYYTMVLQLLESGEVIAGAVEAVRIFDGEQTSGEFTFNEFNLPSGGVEVIADPDLQEPLTITLSGAVDSIVYGSTMTVSAEAGGVTDVHYTWYLNGVSQESGTSTYTTESALFPGLYRLDVTGFTADGTRAGSTTHNFTVTES